ncbi:MAG: hypothetical protein HF975_04250 [ANME-2 cluster archaeon]|nr:hypothetical protein [ANME-2 cluster archaeon]
MSLKKTGKPFFAKCMECGWEREADTLEKARQYATIHIRKTSCLLAFGYPTKMPFVPLKPITQV